MKKSIFILMSSLTLSAYATAPFSPELRGVHIVPLSQQNYSSELKKQLLDHIEEENRNGYRYTDKNPADFLLNFEAEAKNQIKKGNNNRYGVYDTHLKANFSEIKLSFAFNGIPGIKPEDIIGYAAIGSYEKESGREGWNGIRTFFKLKLGCCSYSKSSYLAVQLTKETTEYFVNSKPSKKYIIGNPEHGFLYEIEWFDQENMHVLECANRKLNIHTMDQLKQLALIIDKG